MKTISRYIMTLALLLTAVTGAWADESSETFATNKGKLEYTGQHVKVTATHLYDTGVIQLWQDKQATIETLNGETINSIVVTASVNPQCCTDVKTTAGNVQGGNPTTTITGINATSVILSSEYYVGISEITVYYTAPEPAIEVTPVAGKTNEWTFTMPAFDVEIAPIYAPVAQWAKVENVDQLPTAIEGIYAESTDAIVKAGTVAKIGETENPQGIVMYAVTSTNQATAPALDAFSADVPTAKDITAAGDVYVWYYIKGADTPQDQEPTAENTFNDSEICAEPLKVTVLNNKFNLTLSPAPVEKVSVTIDGTAATPDQEGKIEAVKLGKEVKMTAKEGYKFRKVEVKKAAPALKTLTVNGKQLNYVEGDTWQQAIERTENAGSAWKVQGNYILNGAYTLFTNGGGSTYVYVRPGDTIDATKNYSLEAD